MTGFKSKRIMANDRYKGLLIPADIYIKDAEKSLLDAEWDDNDTEAERLRDRIQHARQILDSGSLYIPEF